MFRAIQDGVPQVEVSAAATLPSPLYRSPAPNRALGLAVANARSSGPISLRVTARDTEGNRLGSAAFSLPPLAHTSFNLHQKLPNLPSSFVGSVEVIAEQPTDQFVAWALNSDGSVLSTLPSGTQSWPVSHWGQICLVYRRVFSAAQSTLAGIVDLNSPPIALDISSDRVINAFATGDGRRIQINLALAELISDSPSELASVVAHELAHIVQVRTGRLTFVPTNRESDADQMGMLFCLAAGFDPYAGAGALAKLIRPTLTLPMGPGYRTCSIC